MTPWSPEEVACRCVSSPRAWSASSQIFCCPAGRCRCLLFPSQRLWSRSRERRIRCRRKRRVTSHESLPDIFPLQGYLNSCPGLDLVLLHVDPDFFVHSESRGFSDGRSDGRPHRKCQRSCQADKDRLRMPRRRLNLWIFQGKVCHHPPAIHLGIEQSRTNESVDPIRRCSTYNALCTGPFIYLSVNVCAASAAKRSETNQHSDVDVLRVRPEDLWLV